MKHALLDSSSRSFSLSLLTGVRPRKGTRRFLIRARSSRRERYRPGCAEVASSNLVPSYRPARRRVALSLSLHRVLIFGAVCTCFSFSWPVQRGQPTASLFCGCPAPSLIHLSVYPAGSFCFFGGSPPSPSSHLLRRRPPPPRFRGCYLAGKVISGRVSGHAHRCEGATDASAAETRARARSMPAI